MIIKKILTIKNLGTFNNFQWISGCNEFKRYNFLYGWNYSGKTTLSRIFKCLEDKKLHPDFPNVSFILETDNDNITERDIGKDFNIRVFNEEFIEENFKWNDERHEIEPVLILGKKSVELEDEVKNLTKNKIDKEKARDEILRKKTSTENELEDLLRNKASFIRSILGITNPKEFDKNILEDEITKAKDNYENDILSDDLYQSSLNIINTTMKYEIVDKINIQLKLNDYINNVKNILKKQVAAQQIIEKLRNNPELNAWVRKGIDLHKNETVCQFCGNKLPQDLFDKLNKHFSEEFDNLISEIKDTEKAIENHKIEIEKFQIPDKARLLSEYSNEYEKKQKIFKVELVNYIKSLETLSKKLKLKKDKPFETLKFGDVDNNQQNIEDRISEINNTITNSNLKVQNLDNEKNQAKEKIIKHLVATSIKEIKYFVTKQSINNYKKQITELDKEIKEIEDKISNINQQIRFEAIGAEKINRYLKQFFNDDKLHLKLLESGKYQIFRDDKIAKNLSTGEKNIIALIYFFALLEEKNFNLSQSIIFIDDPVSSLDSNHIFKVYGFLNEKLKKCGQLFITTHNFDFFNLLKDFNKYDLRNKGISFLIKKISKSQGIKESIIENIPSVLLNFKSEYNYLFSLLKKFNDSSDKEMLYLMPNIARRFLEAYLFMKYPDGKKFKDKCKKFFEGIKLTEKHSILKLLDEYSHEESTDHALKFPDINEIESSIKIILEILELKDKEHYEALRKSMEKLRQ